MTPPRSVPRRSFVARLLALVAGAGALLRPRGAAATPAADDAFVGEIKLFAGDFAPSGWAFCEGQLLNPNSYNSLFSLIGTSYGGDGNSTFALPDLRGRAPMHYGNAYPFAALGGAETVALLADQIPTHTHAAMGSSAVATSDLPAGRAAAKSAGGAPLYASTPDVSLNSGSMATAGGSAAHPNMQPWIALNFIIALDGVYPQVQ